MTRNNCVYDGISNDWSGYYNTDQHPSCSPLKSTSLPGCAESSSSVGEDEQSSSSEVPVSSEAESSSSEEEELESSSSGEFDSSSSEGNVFVAGANQEYAPGKIYSSGLHNMEPGKCYSLNPERGTQRGWISTNAQDSWWWIETPCEKNGKGLYKRVSGHKMGRNKAFGVKQPVYSKKNSKVEDNLDN